MTLDAGDMCDMEDEYNDIKKLILKVAKLIESSDPADIEHVTFIKRGVIQNFLHEDTLSMYLDGLKISLLSEIDIQRLERYINKSSK